MSWLITGSEKVARDPYLYTNTVLLLKGDGTNGSTTILDSSKVAGSPKTVTAVGNAQISTAIADPFNNSTGVIAFDGNGDALTVSGLSTLAQFTASAQIGTIEGWIYVNTFTSPRSCLLGLYENALERGWTIDFTTGGDIFIGNNSAGTTVTLSTKFVSGQWQHLAVVNTGSSLTVFRGGIQVGTTSNQSPTSSTESFRIGARGTTNILPFNGYIDDLRITQGVARYTANFTPPTAPFPDI